MTVVSQSRLGSFVEVVINTIIGFIINYTANLLILPLFGFHISLSDNFIMGLLYTLISVARSYIIRRWFNGHIHRAAMKIANEHEPNIT